MAEDATEVQPTKDEILEMGDYLTDGLHEMLRDQTEDGWLIDVGHAERNLTTAKRSLGGADHFIIVLDEPTQDIPDDAKPRYSDLFEVRIVHKERRYWKDEPAVAGE